MNNLYTIKVGHPILRPGVSIETEASERYVVKVTNMLLKLAREINHGTGGTINTDNPNIDVNKFIGDPHGCDTMDK